MKKAAIVSLVFLIGAGLTGCSNPMNEKITKENYSEVVDRVRKSSSPEDWKKVEAIMMMARLGAIAGKSEAELLEGKSFNDVIANIKAKNEHDAKAAKEESEHSEKLAGLFEVLSWTKGTNVDRFGINKNARISLELKNKTDSDVDAFEANILVFDKLQNQLAKFRIKETELLKAQEKRSLAYDLSTIDYQNRVQEIFNTKAADLRFKFEPTKVLLKDGTVL